MLNIALLLGVKICLVNSRFSQVADSEKWGNKSRMGCKVEKKLLTKGWELVVSLGGTGRRGGGGGGSIQAPRLSVQRKASLFSLKVDFGRKGLAKLVHPCWIYYLVVTQRLQKFSCGELTTINVNMPLPVLWNIISNSGGNPARCWTNHNSSKSCIFFTRCLGTTANCWILFQKATHWVQDPRSPFPTCSKSLWRA